MDAGSIDGDGAAPTERTTVHRHPERADYDRSTIHEVLDEALLCTVSWVDDDGRPRALPTIQARIGDTLYLHGSRGARAWKAVAGGAEVCVVATVVDEIVLARTSPAHSMNYRSVVVFGRGHEVTDARRARTPRRGRSPATCCRGASSTRRARRRRLAPDADRRDADRRGERQGAHGPPKDDEHDLALDVWAGTLPLRLVVGAPVPVARPAAGHRRARRTSRHRRGAPTPVSAEAPHPAPASAGSPSSASTSATGSHAILDEAIYCHLAWVGADGDPRVIPTIHARIDDTLYVHGSAASSTLRAIKRGLPVAIAVTIVDGIRFARSMFEHSMNYRTVIVYGRAEEVTDRDELARVFDAITDHVAAGRSADARRPNDDELRQTTFVKVVARRVQRQGERGLPRGTRRRPRPRRVGGHRCRSARCRASRSPTRCCAPRHRDARLRATGYRRPGGSEPSRLGRLGQAQRRTARARRRSRSTVSSPVGGDRDERDQLVVVGAAGRARCDSGRRSSRAARSWRSPVRTGAGAASRAAARRPSARRRDRRRARPHVAIGSATASARRSRSGDRIVAELGARDRLRRRRR